MVFFEIATELEAFKEIKQHHEVVIAINAQQFLQKFEYESLKMLIEKCSRYNLKIHSAKQIFALQTNLHNVTLFFALQINFRTTTLLFALKIIFRIAKKCTQ